MHDEVTPETLDRSERGCGVIVHWPRGRGEVFTAATCEWVMGLCLAGPPRPPSDGPLGRPGGAQRGAVGQRPNPDPRTCAEVRRGHLRVLRRLGYGDDEIASLHERGVVADRWSDRYLPE